jgi:hypothetical protein
MKIMGQLQGTFQIQVGSLQVGTRCFLRGLLRAPVDLISQLSEILDRIDHDNLPVSGIFIICLYIFLSFSIQMSQQSFTPRNLMPSLSWGPAAWALLRRLATPPSVRTL